MLLQESSLVKKSFVGLVCIALVLCIVSLIIELLPEMEAKEIVIPTLILVGGLLVIDIRNRLSPK